ncbi:glycosyltransferase family 2 protein [Fodinibius saliphilus]|uniref:glycosyltransferase family 2 protein n=1 Tax=Fodinibius saliphilus TaxID=1920650 RepID=UPI0011097ECC|nr:glycosyltransferase family 2 protein [Fodinibius saliphilus]
MTFFEVIQYSVAIIFGLFLINQFLFSIFALKANKKDDFSTTRQRKFAIMLTGHNLESIITRSLYSLSGLVYPQSLYDLIVIADNCTDNTVEVSERLGARVLHRKEGTPESREYMIKWGLQQLNNIALEYDAVVFIDAGSLISGNYLEVMNYYLEQGSLVIQSNYQLLPKKQSRFAEIVRIEFLLKNFVRPLGRKALGLETVLRGSGMCFSTRLLEQIPWKARSRNDVSDYGLEIQLSDILIEFAPEASVSVEFEPESREQFARVLKSIYKPYSGIFKWGPKLWGATFQKGNIRFLELFIDLIMPRSVTLIVFPVTLMIVSILLWEIGWSPMSVILVWMILAGLGMLQLYIGLTAADLSHRLYWTAMYVPKNLITKIKYKFANYWQGNKNDKSSQFNEKKETQGAKY